MHEERSAKVTGRMVAQAAVAAIGIPLLPLLITTDWRWGEAWAFFVFSALGFFVSRWLADRRHPGIIAERWRKLDHENIKSFDKVLAPVVALGLLPILIVVGIDHRLEATASFFPAWSRWLALAVLVAAYVLGTWALLENEFFSGVVRIQHDRGHHVVSSGPYRLVRHPGYSGTLLYYLMCPIGLSSLWAFIPVAMVAVALVWRTALEDRTLAAELPGYAEYAQRTRFRLIPGVW